MNLPLTSQAKVFANPVSSIARYSARAGIPFQTGSRCVDRLVKAGFLREVTGNRCNRLFVSDELMPLMSGQSRTLRHRTPTPLNPLISDI